MNGRVLPQRLPLAQIVRTAHATALRLAATGLSLAFGILGARLLGADVFGTFVSVFALAGLLSVATSSGLSTILLRDLAASRNHGDNAALTPVLHGIVLVIGILGAACVASLFAGWTVVGLGLAFCVAGNIVAILGAFYRGTGRTLLAAWIANVARPAVAIAALGVLALITTPTIAVPLVAQIAGAVAAVVAFTVLARGRPHVPVARALRRTWWSHHHSKTVRAAMLLSSNQVLMNMTTQVDILILTVVATPEEVAHYYAAARSALVVGFFSTSSGLLAEPAMSRLHAARSPERLQTLVTTTSAIGATVTLLAAVAAVLVAPFYLALFGPGYEDALPSFLVFTVGIVLNSVFGPTLPLLRATRCERDLLQHTMIALIVNAGITVALVPLVGIVGAAMGSAVQFMIHGATTARETRRLTAIRCDVGTIIQGRVRVPEGSKDGSATPAR